MAAPDRRLVDLVLEELRWEEIDLPGLAERAARAALESAGLAPDDFEISLLAADDARIAALNAAHRGRTEPTNVLSWPAFRLAPGEAPPADPGGMPVLLGDVALAFETCSREAAEAGLTLEDHATHLVVHGILHLLGFDHEDAAEADRMEALEAKILASLGVADPYGR